MSSPCVRMPGAAGQRLLLSVLMLWLLQGCGIKGPLYLPEEAEPPHAPPAREAGLQPGPDGAPVRPQE